MYATFTGFRLGADGSVFYALAASPPILQWHAGGRTLSHTEEPQFPLGLLPVSSFDGARLETAPGDLLVVATDGILEVCNKPGEEFGVERLKEVIAANANDPLPATGGKDSCGGAWVWTPVRRPNNPHRALFVIWGLSTGHQRLRSSSAFLAA